MYGHHASHPNYRRNRCNPKRTDAQDICCGTAATDSRQICSSPRTSSLNTQVLAHFSTRTQNVLWRSRDCGRTILLHQSNTEGRQKLKELYGWQWRSPDIAARSPSCDEVALKLWQEWRIEI